MRRAVIALVCALVTAGSLAVVPSVSALGVAPVGSVGIDVSYPNCGMPVPAATFGIVGVTGGAPYTANPCLASQATQVRALSLYANTGWNPKSPYISATSPHRCARTDSSCPAYNYGYNAGLAAFALAAKAGVRASTWWLDVELGNTWGAVAQNRASLQGEYDALRARGVATIGAYSTTVQWASITGAWVNGWPSWGATVLTSLAQARTYCTGHRFTGGATWLIQFRSVSGADLDVACLVPSAPSAPRGLKAAFPRSHTAAVAWAAPIFPGTARVSSYRVRWSSTAGRTWSPWVSVGLHRTATRTRLVKGHAYRVQVRAINAVGAGAVVTLVFTQRR